MKAANLLIRLLTALCVLNQTLAAFAPMITAPPALIARAYEPGDESPSCYFFNSRLRSCAASTGGATLVNPATLFGCLCYDSSTLAPRIFDNGLQTCLSYLRTANPTAYSSLGPSLASLTTLCDMIASADGTSSPRTSGIVATVTKSTPMAPSKANATITATSSSVRPAATVLTGGAYSISSPIKLDVLVAGILLAHVLMLYY